MLSIPEELFLRCKNREEAAWSDLLSLTGDYLMRIAVANLQDFGLAEDAVQEAYLHAFAKITQVQDQKSFGAWLTKILINECRMLERATRARRKREVPDLDLTLLTSGADSASELELRSAVMELLKQIPPIFREPLILRDLENLEYAEISRIVGVPVGTVRSRIARARTLWHSLIKADLANPTSLISELIGGQHALS